MEMLRLIHGRSPMADGCRYDVTTIRASTPMYLMARKIKAMGVKMVLSGEGADELFGGYLWVRANALTPCFTVAPCSRLAYVVIC